MNISEASQYSHSVARRSCINSGCEVERTNAWLGNFRRLVVRYDRALTIYGAFFHIACFMIVLRRVVQ
jgi:hypothetical protein